MRLLVAKGFMLGFIGALWCVALAVVFVQIISVVGIALPRASVMSRCYQGEILLFSQLLFVTLVLVIHPTPIATSRPAWKAKRINIVDLLRLNQ